MSRIGSYLALDGFYTVITSGVLYVFTRVLAPVFDKSVKDQRDAAKDAEYHSTHPASTHTPAHAATPSHNPALSISEAALAGRVQNSPEPAATV